MNPRFETMTRIWKGKCIIVLINNNLKQVGCRPTMHAGVLDVITTLIDYDIST